MGECNLCGGSCSDNSDYCRDCKRGREESEEMMHPDESSEDFWSHEDED
jgi:predicted Fe-S protein YdhL (DUF1289 family)